MEEQTEKEKKAFGIMQHSKTVKILIIIAKILLLFVMPIFVAILDYFIF
jgi:hypothetical protein